MITNTANDLESEIRTLKMSTFVLYFLLLLGLLAVGLLTGNEFERIEQRIQQLEQKK